MNTIILHYFWSTLPVSLSFHEGSARKDVHKSYYINIIYRFVVLAGHLNDRYYLWYIGVHNVWSVCYRFVKSK